ncbi:DNA-directed RNA polymerase subunit omega [Melioribacter sp. OK-6-Me]|uniref:DNA-directed RNA polymerase subunit omega n=1 Tax=unclassified Melioribacter TaxID=2627329 RepID=UPI003ED91794
MTLRPVDLRKIKSRIPNLYEAVVVAARRARQINDDYKLEFNTLLNTVVTNNDDEFEDKENPEQLKLALEFDKREKPQIRAINELLNEGIEYRYKER